MSLPIQRTWQIQTTIDPASGTTSYNAITNMAPSVSVWTDTPVPSYSPGMLFAREVQSGSQLCYTNSYYAEATLTRLTFSTPAGSEIELVDQATGGIEGGVTACNGPGQSRGPVWVSRDGSDTTFIADSTISDATLLGAGVAAPSGYLIFRNGTRYRIGLNGRVDSITDRNGNQITFTYDQFTRLIQVTDSLARVITVNHGSSYDQIVFPGAGGASRTIQINFGTTSTALDSAYTLGTYDDLFGTFGGSTNQAIWTVVSSLTLPNNQQYQFTYNNYSELAQSTLPTGGKIRYTFGPGYPGTAPGGVNMNNGLPFVYRRVLSRDVYADGATLEQHVVYSASFSSIMFPNPSMSYWATVVTVNHYDGLKTPLGNAPPTSSLLGSDTHKFWGGPNNPKVFALEISYPFWMDGKEYQTVQYAADGITALITTAQNFAQRTCNTGEACLTNFPFDASNGNGSLSPVDPRLTQDTTTLNDASQVSMRTYGYDQYTNKTSETEYDFGSGSPGNAIRPTITCYVTNGYNTLNGTHLPSLVAEEQVYAGLYTPPGQPCASSSTTPSSDTQYCYDGQTGGHCVTASGLVSETLSGYQDPNNAKRGNLTTTARLVTGTSYIQTTAAYDIAGNVVSTTDGRGNITTHSYADNPSTSGVPCYPDCYAFPTVTTNALNQNVTTQYDYYLGKATGITDLYTGSTPSSYLTTITYGDPLDRPTLVVRGAGTGAETHTNYTYCTPNCNTIVSYNDQISQGDKAIVTVEIYDGMGRASESEANECSSGYTATFRTYDGMGRLGQSSNPYMPVTPCLGGSAETAYWTSYGYDALNRPVSVTTPDGSTTRTSYSGNQTTVTDAAGVSRSSISDAAGRVTSVTETGTLTTSYTYDALNNLLSVNQSGRPRNFNYDYLSRITSATNLENGTINYSNYDGNSNLVTVTDARNFTTTNTYDSGERPAPFSKRFEDAVGQAPPVLSDPSVRRGESEMAQLYLERRSAFQITTSSMAPTILSGPRYQRFLSDPK